MKDKLLKEFAEHPALKFANDAIVLAAVRSGTSGYTGKENLTEWLSRALDCMYAEGEKKGRNIGALRQWLNERTETRLITNEDIETFLNL